MPTDRQREFFQPLRADTEPGRQLCERLTHAQVRKNQQHLMPRLHLRQKDSIFLR
jgi:hypothetical protein